MIKDKHRQIGLAWYEPDGFSGFQDTFQVVTDNHNAQKDEHPPAQTDILGFNGFEEAF